jgi:membrane-bound lytic murein transglycosylase F
MISKISNCYDQYFQRSTLEFFGSQLHWLWCKAQAVAESELNPEALSPAGAMGVMQLMPGTAAEMAAKYGTDDDIQLPHVNIRYGIAYDKRCFDVWSKESGRERIRFMLGSYNAGVGNILEAQKLAALAGLATDRWPSIASYLPSITGRHATETINYVAKIERLFDQLIAGEKGK